MEINRVMFMIFTGIFIAFLIVYNGGHEWISMYMPEPNTLPEDYPDF